MNSEAKTIDKYHNMIAKFFVCFFLLLFFEGGGKINKFHRQEPVFIGVLYIDIWVRPFPFDLSYKHKIDVLYPCSQSFSSIFNRITTNYIQTKHYFNSISTCYTNKACMYNVEFIFSEYTMWNLLVHLMKSYQIKVKIPLKFRIMQSLEALIYCFITDNDKVHIKSDAFLISSIWSWWRSGLW